MTTNIRVATEQDAQFVHDVYGYFVEHTNVTFTTENPSVEAYAEKIEHTLQRYPFLIMEANGIPCGFAYAGQIRPHEAYRWTAEGTIYLAPDAPKRRGLGRVLYQALLDILQRQGIQTVFGVITATNEPSLRMHLSMGFKEVGRFKRMGNKRGEWLDVVWMQKTLCTLDTNPLPPAPFLALKDQV
ncbi:MAG TPA: N-acetyltransferase family protein [Candidatus Limiplasma sp.]|nr:N-acetyltransferase family protein [Candidatus Limiplasma sp.]HRX07779.1 N-acetyltransferase family protein [Candidatus Limiplasma sp.]